WTSELMLVTDIYYTIIACNAAFLTSGSRKKEDVIGASLFDILPIGNSAQLNEGYHLALQGQSNAIKDIVDLYARGNFNLKLIPLKTVTNEVEGILHIVSNVTAEYKEQQQHAFRLELLEKIMEISSDIVIALDRNMNYLFWNKKAEASYGIPVKDVIGKNILELFPSFIGDPSYQDLRRVMKGEILHLARPGIGQEEEKETFLFPLKSSNDGITGVLWIVRDLDSPFKSGAPAEVKGTSLVDFNEVFFKLDKDRRFTLVNKKACLQWNRSESELLGKNVWDVFPSGKDLPFFFALEEALDKGIPCQQEFLSCITGRRQYTSITPFESGASVLLIDNSVWKPIFDPSDTLRLRH
ncbi:MAG: PAS domain-containing protein, partial [Chitinophagaceae bacterium]